MSEQTNYDCGRFHGTAAMTLAAAQLGMFRPADAESRKAELADAAAGPTDGLRPFHFNIPEDALVGR